MISLNSIQQAQIQEAIIQSDAIFALEGFSPTEQVRQIDEAVLAGRVSRAQVIAEMVAYAQQYKTTIGFIETRVWA